MITPSAAAEPPRLIALDLDGTIVRPDETISDRTVDALARVRAYGAEVVIVTGRPPRWLPRVADRVGRDGLAVCANGALVYDLASERIIERFVIEAAILGRLVDELRAAIPGATFAVEDGHGLRHEPDYPLEWDLGLDGVRLVEAADLVGSDAPKLLLRDPSGDPDGLLVRALEVVGDLAELTHSSRSSLIEISATGVTKATTLATVCTERGIEAHHVAAFGDMPNDLPMLAWAGRAYAVANAHSSVLAAVDDLVPSVHDDGVAQMLEALFPD